MKKTSSTQSIILNVVMFVQMNQLNGITTNQRMVNTYLKNIYHQNPLMFGSATWTSVSGTFRSMVSKTKNNTDSNRGLEEYIKVKEKKGVNVLSLKKQPSIVR